MYLVAKTSFQRFLVRGWMECSSRVKFGVQFQVLGKVMADDDAGEPPVRPAVHEIVANLPIQIDRAELFRKFERQDQACASWCDSSFDGVIRIINGKLREK